jgi:hypothetical protein
VQLLRQIAEFTVREHLPAASSFRPFAAYGANRGIMRGHVAVPIRLQDGTLAGYIGITEAKLPPRWHGIPSRVVVPLRKPA